MPPRTRAITSTSPAGRRPKVAGLRAPRRHGGDQSRPEDTADAVDAPEVADLGPDAAPEAPVDDATTESAATDAGSSDGTDGEADRPAPSSKARRGNGAMSAGATPTGAAGGPRSGTAVLERPARRPREEAPRKGTGSTPPRTGRLAGALGGAAAPFRRLGGNPRMLQVVLGTVVVVCLVLAGLAFWQGRQAWTQGPVSNQAVVDVGGTAEVVGQTRQGLEQMLSYDFTKLDDSVNAARADSTGAFQSQYLSVFEQTIRGPATQQKLRQTASVLNIGVKQLDADHASLMVLVQFSAQRTTNQQSTNAPGLLNVDVVRQDGRWKISALNPM